MITAMQARKLSEKGVAQREAHSLKSVEAAIKSRYTRGYTSAERVYVDKDISPNIIKTLKAAKYKVKVVAQKRQYHDQNYILVHIAW